MSEQKSKWHTTRQTKMDELFSGRKFEIVEEFKSDVPVATPLGYKVKSGYKLRLLNGAEGEVVEYVVGKSLLKVLAENYSAVEKPPTKKRGRPRKQPLELAEEWAGRDLPADASPITQPGGTLVNPNADQSFEG